MFTRYEALGSILTMKEGKKEGWEREKEKNKRKKA
jgi:hypothetical protein